jgi:hypothetical protein
MGTVDREMALFRDTILFPSQERKRDHEKR